MLKRIAIGSLVGFVLVMFAATAFAEVSTRGLTDEQRAQLEVQAAQFKAENVKAGGAEVVEKIAEVNPDNLQKYADVGEAIAKSLGAAAKEMGVAVNEFMQSPAGLLTVVLIVYHFIGAELLSFLFAGCFLIPLVTILWWKYIKNVRTKELTRNEKGKLERVTFEHFSDDHMYAIVWPTVLFILLLFALVVIALP